MIVQTTKNKKSRVQFVVCHHPNPRIPKVQDQIGLEVHLKTDSLKDVVEVLPGLGLDPTQGLDLGRMTTERTRVLIIVISYYTLFSVITPKALFCRSIVI